VGSSSGSAIAGSNAGPNCTASAASDTGERERATAAGAGSPAGLTAANQTVVNVVSQENLGGDADVGTGAALKKRYKTKEQCVTKAQDFLEKTKQAVELLVGEIAEFEVSQSSDIKARDRLQLRLNTAQSREISAQTKLEKAREALSNKNQHDIKKQMDFDRKEELKALEEADKALWKDKHEDLVVTLRINSTAEFDDKVNSSEKIWHERAHNEYNKCVDSGEIDGPHRSIMPLLCTPRSLSQKMYIHACIHTMYAPSCVRRVGALFGCMC